MPGDYIKCPRCQLNYIKRGEEYCDVCKAELKKGPQLVFAVDEEEEQETMILCPICHRNYIKQDELMCEKCAQEQEYKKGQEDPDKDEEWKNYLADEEDDEEEVEDEEMLSLNKLAEEEDSEMFKDDDVDEEDEEEIIASLHDDFDFPEVNEADFEGIDEEDDEEDEDEESDEDF